MAMSVYHIELKLRWFYKPALLMMLVAARCGMINDTDAAARWLVKRTVRLTVTPARG